MTSPNWLQTLGKIAPTLAATLGGPFGALAAPFISTALGLVIHSDDPNAPKADPAAELQKRIEEGSLTGDQILALRKANADFEQHIADNKLKLDQLRLEDVASARAREIAVKDQTPRQLALVMVFGFFTLTAAVIGVLIGYPDKAKDVPPAAWGLIGTLIGYLLNESSKALNYYFGTTEGNESSVSVDALSSLGAATKPLALPAPQQR